MKNLSAGMDSENTPSNIVAGIVTYNPDVSVLTENVNAISSQVKSVVIYDNGSENVEAVVGVSLRRDNTSVISAAENSGIATGMNRIVRFAIENGATAVLTLDQDSVASPNLVLELARHLTTKTPIITPYIIDRNKMSIRDYEALSLPVTQKYSHAASKGAISSGSLILLEVFSRVGYFDESMFIDYVDYDFNQRVMSGGLSILRANRTYLLHEVGHARSTRFWTPRKTLDGRWTVERFYSFGHSPERCYYKARNRVKFTRRYWKAIGLTNEGIWQIPQQIVLTLLFEDRKVDKLRAFLRGVRDGISEPIDFVWFEYRGPMEAER